MEYAVSILNISKIIIVGHSKCGGINSGYKLCKSQNFKTESFFIDKWLTLLKPAFEKMLSKNQFITDDEGIKYLEKESILVSIENLINFPFIKKALQNNTLDIHGVWHDIGTGNIESFDPILQKFVKV